MNDFLPDLGTAIANKTITLNAEALLSNVMSTEATQEVFGHLGHIRSAAIS